MVTQEQVRAAFLAQQGEACKSRTMKYWRNPEGLHVLTTEGVLTALSWDRTVYVLGTRMHSDRRQTMLLEAIRAAGRGRQWLTWPSDADPNTIAPSEVFCAVRRAEQALYTLAPPREECEILAEREAQRTVGYTTRNRWAVTATPVVTITGTPAEPAEPDEGMPF